jgi:hypothetical protein
MFRFLLPVVRSLLFAFRLTIQTLNLKFILTLTRFPRLKPPPFFVVEIVPLDQC